MHLLFLLQTLDQCLLRTESFGCSGRMWSLELDVQSLGTNLTPPESECGC